ncbi:aldehyde dehydrogenase family protein [Candidatus Dojkabacteria bacterium]|nr:aldehyde dehydrogenase family protein [Candidatus Dojkabacteria bacterium]
MKLISTNPANSYKKIGEVKVSTPEEIDGKVLQANKSKELWKKFGVKERVKLLTPIRDEFKERTQEIAELISIETGKVITESLSEVTRYTDELTWFLENGEIALKDKTTLDDETSLHWMTYEPYGVCASIAPWNFPFGMSIWGIFPNLIVGNTVVFKISEETPLVGELLEEIINKHNLPTGVFSEVYGGADVGKYLTKSDINLMWFTGSTRTGQSLYKTAADKLINVVLEMGGSNPCIVFEDANIEQTTPVIFTGRFRNCGQVCTSLKRLIAHEEIATPLINELQELTEKQKIGNPLDPKTDLGSLVAERQLRSLDIQLKDALDKGAKIIAQSTLSKDLKGAFFPPTLLTGITPDMKVWYEEVFGPILPIVTFRAEKEAIKLANDTVYGLGARIISKDLARAKRVASKIDAGTIAINYESRFLACDPFGGYKNSGIGRERGIHGLQELCQIKVVQTSK